VKNARPRFLRQVKKVNAALYRSELCRF
jgi:hypothetical protein